MLNWYVMQFGVQRNVAAGCCDLMLNWYVMQFAGGRANRHPVVI